MSEINPAINEDERVVEIEVERLRDFCNHPFKVIEDQQMLLLIDSIGKYGILNPLIVRPLPEGVYEIVSGHRRKYAAIKLGYRKLPVIIRVLRDDDAVIGMVDSNLHRDGLLPSEKAFAYKMKNDALKRRGGRRKRGQSDDPYSGRKTVQLIGDETGESPKQIQRYLKLTELIPDLLDKLDKGELSFNPAYEIAFLTIPEQRAFLHEMEYSQNAPTVSQAQRIKDLSKEGKLTPDRIREILGEVKKGELNRVMFRNEQLRKFFPKEYSAARMKEEILRLLAQWSETGSTSADSAQKAD